MRLVSVHFVGAWLHNSERHTSEAPKSFHQQAIYTCITQLIKAKHNASQNFPLLNPA